MSPERRPNLVLLITDQQRAPMHWPQEPGWLDALMPNDMSLRRTGVSFERALCSSAMCSPSRASFLTGTYPSRHGVTLTLTRGDLWPDLANFPDVMRVVGRLAVSGEVGRARLARAFLRGLTRTGPRGGNEPELPAGIPTLATRLRAAGYHVAYKGKWHLTQPLSGDEWSPADGERVERDFGFSGWEPPDAGENAKAEHFGGGNAGLTHEGWDEDYVRQVEAFLAQRDLPEPFCLVVSLVNPHDVLGYPACHVKGGYTDEQFAHLDVPLPPTIDESLADKPGVQSLTKLGQTSYLGALRTREQQLAYVRFYAYLHGVVDEKIGRVLRALGDPDDPASLRSRTVITRIADHGEMGLSHGGLRQKMFNAYEETLRVPFVVSSPVLFPGGGETAALASLVDVLPTFLGLAGATAEGTLDGASMCGVLARHAVPEREALAASGVRWDGVLRAAPAERVRDAVLFTYDDHQAATAMQEAPGQPNRIRCVRDERWKYAVYLDPTGRATPEYELYDLDADPVEARNRIDPRSGEPRGTDAAREHARLAEALREACAQTATLVPALPIA